MEVGAFFNQNNFKELDKLSSVVLKNEVDATKNKNRTIDKK